MSIVKLALASALVVASGSATQAAMVTKTYSFSASNFLPTPVPPPVPVVLGSFTVTFDDSANIFDTTSGITISSLNIPVTSQIAFTHETGPFGYVRFGGLETGSGTLMTNTNDILFQFSESFGGVLFYSSTLTPNTNFFTTDVSVTVTNGGAVPEPSSWAMMVLGFAAIGAGLRRKSVVTAIATLG